jgi:hypothetical protein
MPGVSLIDMADGAGSLSLEPLSVDQTIAFVLAYPRRHIWIRHCMLVEALRVRQAGVGLVDHVVGSFLRKTARDANGVSSGP